MDKILILTLWEVIKTDNYQFLDIDYKEGKRYSEADKQELNAAWMVLRDSWFNAKDSIEARNLLSQSAKRLELELRMKHLIDIRNSLVFLVTFETYLSEESFFEKKKQCFDLIKEASPKWKGNMFNSCASFANDIDSMIKSATNMYNEKVKVVDKKIEKEEKTIYATVAIMSKILGMQLSIKEMFASEFLEYEKIATELSKPKPTNGKG